MKAEFLPHKQKIAIECERDAELDALSMGAFTRKIANAQFRTRGKSWDGSVSFLEKQKYIPVGLWKRLSGVIKSNGFTIDLHPSPFNMNANKDEIEKFCHKIVAGGPDWMEVRPYQIDAVFNLYKYRWASLDLATGAGKTTILFLYYCYLVYKRELNKFLIVTADSELVVQAYQDFMDYNNGRFDMKIGMVHGGTKLRDHDGYRCIIGNIDTLAKRPKDFFEPFTHVAGDEIHRVTLNSRMIKQCIGFCTNRVSAVGVSGTIKEEDTADHWTIEAFTGPVVQTVTQKELMDMGYAAKVNIVVVLLDYLTNAEKKKLAKIASSGKLTELELYEHELTIIRNSQKRREYIAKFIASTDGNHCCFYHDVKNETGRKYKDSMAAYASHRRFLYLDGEVKKDVRRDYFKRMNENDDHSLVASYKLFGTGKSIPNLQRFFMLEPLRSEKLLAQAMGRGMRLMKDDSKQEFWWYDFVDDFRYKESGRTEADDIDFKNVLYKQYEARRKHYHDSGFEYFRKKAKLVQEAGESGSIF